MDELKNKALELGASDLGLSQIKDKNGVHVMTKKTSPSFWSYKILW